MRHPVENTGEKRVCPVTGKQFHECWTNNLLRPWTEFNECDSCAPHRETIPETLRRLNDERTNDVVPTQSAAASAKEA